MTKALVLGSGLIGRVIAQDLSKDMKVTVADHNPDAVKGLYLNLMMTDLSDTQMVRKLALENDIVVGALPSHMGLKTLQTIIEAGRPYVDISFMDDDPQELHSLATKKGVTAVVDCGVAPGLSNMLAGHATTQLDPCREISIYVGGVPATRTKPFEYKAGFAPADVIEEYTRPARMVEDGKVVVHDPLSGVEHLEFEGLGTLEAFYTDGLRTMLNTLGHIQDISLSEKTMRYPGHSELMRVFRETGFFSKEKIKVGGVEVRPLDVAQTLLFPKWKFGRGERDLTVMRVEAKGLLGGCDTTLRWNLIDRGEPTEGLLSMSRCTAYPATTMARLVSKGRFNRPGVHPPEAIGMTPGLLDDVLLHLAHKGVTVDYSVE